MSRYYNDFSDLDSGDDLEHYGVPGMKWGVRKQTYNPMSPGGALHYGRKVAKADYTARRTMARNSHQATHKIIGGALHGVHEVGKAFRMTGKRVHEGIKKTEKEVRPTQKQFAKKGIEMTRRHLTLSGHIKVSGIQKDVQDAGETWVRLHGRGAA